MAAAYRSSTVNNTGATTAASLALTLPSGWQPNDALFASVSADGGAAATITGPAGWTLLRSSAGTNIKHNLYWKLADPNEPASYTWTFDTARAGAGVMAAYSGAHPFQPPTTSQTINNTASTSVNMASAVSTYTGLGVHFLTARNTTAASTTTPGGSWAARQDTCTTAGTFMEIELSDLPKTFSMGGLPANTATSTQSVASANICVFLDDARPTFNSLGEDEYFVTGITTTVAGSTITVQTNYPNEVVLLFCSINKDVATISSVATTGLTWALVGRSNTNAGSTELWRTIAPSPGARSTTITFSASIVSANISYVGIIGADFTGTNGSGAIGSFVTGSTTAAVPSLNVTTTRNNSWVWFACNAAGTTGNPTVGANQLVVRSQSDATNNAMGWLQRQNNITPASGTVVTMNDSSPTANCNMLAVEILPEVYRNLGAMGAG